MRIAIDARYVADHFPGIGRYVYNLLTAFAALDQPHTFAVLYDPSQRNTRHDMAALSRHLSMRLVPTQAAPFSVAEQIQLPQLLRSIRADLYHAPYYVRPYRGVPCPSVTTLYDVIPRLFPAEATPRARMLFDMLSRQAIRASRQLIAISQSARADFGAAYNVPITRITVTPLAASARFQPQPRFAIAALRTKYRLPEQYVLCVSSNKPHKNLATLIQAWARLKAEQGDQDTQKPATILAFPSPASAVLVIAGHWEDQYPEAHQLVDRLGLQASVRFLPDVQENDLPTLYSGALFFVFPSRYEGFGLPPLEAMASGAPVLCGGNSSLPEVVGAAALRVDVDDVDAMRRCMAMLLGNAGLRSRMRDAGLRQASTFSWRATAEATLKVYESSR